MTVPDLDLSRVPASRARAPKRVEFQNAAIELAVAPEALVMERAAIVPTVGDLAFDAKLLADYGEPPKHWLLRPMYAWRVFWRRRELKRALLVRREESTRAAEAVDDALVAVAEQVRTVAESLPAFATAIGRVRSAEDVLRSRDRVFAAEQDAQSARLAQFDARLRAMEAELAEAQAEERSVAADLAAAQSMLVREEGLRKRGDSIKRTAVPTGGEGTGG
jgi:hypothetical protein